MQKLLPLRTRCVNNLADLERWVDSWRLLADRRPMLSPEWAISWWQHYRRENDELCVILLDDHRGQLIGIAPLYIENKGRQRVIKFLGSGEVCTDHQTILSAPGWEVRAADALAQFLMDNRDRWDGLFFESIDAKDTAMGRLVTQLSDAGSLAHRRPTASCWRLCLPRTWDDYLSMLSKSHRRRCRRLHEEYFDSGRVTTRCVSSPGDFEYGYRILEQLHSARWEATGQSGIFASDRFRRFHASVGRQLLSLGQLRLVWLECEGKPIAVEYALCDGKTVYAYQSGRDIEYPERQPGNLSAIAMIRFAIENGYESIDFLRGDEPYKAHWRATPSPCFDLRVWPGRLSGRVHHTMWGFRDAAKQWLNAEKETVET